MQNLMEHEYGWDNLRPSFILRVRFNSIHLLLVLLRLDTDRGDYLQL